MKAYTDLEQSSKLAEILPIESTDNYYSWHDERYYIVNKDCPYPYSIKERIPCWSLSALLNYLREIDFFPNIEPDEHSVIMSISYYDEKEARPLAPIHSIKVETDTFVDACYEMIIKLHEQKLL